MFGVIEVVDWLKRPRVKLRCVLEAFEAPLFSYGLLFWGCTALEFLQMKRIEQREMLMQR